MPRRFRRNYKWKAISITRDQLQITVCAPRYWAGHKLATLVVHLDAGQSDGPRRVEATLDLNLPLPDTLVRALRVFCGGMDWPEEIRRAMRQAKLDYPVRVGGSTEDPELEVVWSGQMEAAGQVPGLATAIPSSWDAMAAALQADLVAATEPCPAERVAAIRAGIKASAQRTSEQSDTAILARLRCGFTYQSIAEELGISYQIVTRVARQAGIRRRAQSK